MPSALCWSAAFYAYESAKARQVLLFTRYFTPPRVSFLPLFCDDVARRFSLKERHLPRSY